MTIKEAKLICIGDIVQCKTYNKLGINSNPNSIPCRVKRVAACRRGKRPVYVFELEPLQGYEWGCLTTDMKSNIKYYNCTGNGRPYTHQQLDLIEKKAYKVKVRKVEC